MAKKALPREKRQDVSQSLPIQWVEINTVQPNPKNRNQHSDAQIERLAKLIEYQGWRWPLIISNQSKLLVAGHGRLAAAKLLGLKTVPTVFQDFKDSDQEYAFGISDNSIALWADLDLAGINADLPEITLPDLELLGIENFTIDPSPQIEKKKGLKILECPHCEAHFEQKQAKVVDA